MRDHQPLSAPEITDELDRRINNLAASGIDAPDLKALRDWIMATNAGRQEFRDTFTFGNMTIHSGGVYDVTYAQWGGRVITLHGYTFQGRGGFDWRYLRFTKRGTGHGTGRDVPIEHVKAILPQGHAL